ncbi:hypothetical protein PHSY_007357 [Pseudozyma hubeiensis SY62]|uniref:Uncharacterized protein n=1 Tax=Pseudozyma hubeiensis (strain SY62) TaxID=1305764 RepID=R9PEH0_PSEHS|nr:hypothetical protein PHSY_007357 [Pseudozyma hubeiensis SY62]GAC99754.1 hypothetical protein PHSY_007357 [Pseudozyma hubeiensis SY62]
MLTRRGCFSTTTHEHHSMQAVPHDETQRQQSNHTSDIFQADSYPPVAKPRLQPIEKPIVPSSSHLTQAFSASAPSEDQKQDPLANSIISVLDLPK